MTSTETGPPPRPHPRHTIVAESLSRSYAGRTVVDGVTFHCEPGTVTGFLGPNGAGKSTTLRMICGLTRPSAGRSSVCGRPYRSLPDPGRRCGVLLDAGAQHAGRTGRETLTLTARVLRVPASRVEAVLERVGLAGAPARRRVGTYSLGQRQRLGLANALLGDPAVLILDEPANGLDPQGMRWMRGLVAGHAAAGGTVLLSSHLLSEVERVADRLVVISGGRIAAQGTRDEIAGSGGLEDAFLRLTGAAPR